MSTATLNGHAAHDTRWHTISVRDFFGQIPWTGVPAPMPSMPPGAATTQTTEVEVSLNLHMSVGDFFNQFPWDGKPQIAAPIPTESFEAMLEQSPDDGITLDGFADMF